MKSTLLVLTLVFSVAAMAKIPATEGFNRLLASGEYLGQNESGRCSVTVNTQTDSVSVSIKAASSYNVFALLNSSFQYSVNESTGEIAATQSLNFPRYLQGGTAILNVKANNITQIEFSITNILLDHKGNDVSTYSACTISI